MEYMHEYLLLHTLDPKPNKLELDLSTLLSKEAFVKVIKENVSKENKKEEDK